MLVKDRYDKNVRKRIEDVLSEEIVASLKDVIKKAKTTRDTAISHLDRLVREGVAIEMKKGPVRLFMLKRYAER